jgi:hypothetical protein
MRIQKRKVEGSEEHCSGGCWSQKKESFDHLKHVHPFVKRGIFDKFGLVKGGVYM